MKKYFLIAFLIWSPFYVGIAQNADIDLLRKFNTENPSEDYSWRGITNTIEYVPAAYTVANLSYGLITEDKNALRYTFESTMSFTISQAVNSLIKFIINRPRPSQSYPKYIETYSYTDGYSFPSGHTSLAFATATTMAYQAHELYFNIPIFTWSSGVGFSRMRLGKHYPSDVFVGALIGIGSGILAHWATGQIIH